MTTDPPDGYLEHYADLGPKVLSVYVKLPDGRVVRIVNTREVLDAGVDLGAGR